MRRNARRRHMLIWFVLAPALGLGIAVGLSQRPPQAISEGPVPIADVSAEPVNSDRIPATAGGQP